MTKRYAAILIALAVAMVMMFIGRGRKQFYTSEGVVWTTEYHITYEADRDLGDSIQLIFNNIDISVSPYNKASLISSLNENTSGVSIPTSSGCSRLRGLSGSRVGEPLTPR